MACVYSSRKARSGLGLARVVRLFVWARRTNGTVATAPLDPCAREMNAKRGNTRRGWTGHGEVAQDVRAVGGDGVDVALLEEELDERPPPLRVVEEDEQAPEDEPRALLQGFSCTSAVPSLPRSMISCRSFRLPIASSQFCGAGRSAARGQGWARHSGARVLGRECSDR